MNLGSIRFRFLLCKREKHGRRTTARKKKLGMAERQEKKMTPHTHFNFFCSLLARLLRFFRFAKSLCTAAPLPSNKIGKRGFPQHSKETRTRERHRRLSHDPRKRKGRARTQAISYYKRTLFSSWATKQISKWLVPQGTSNIVIFFLKYLSVFFTEAD